MAAIDLTFLGGYQNKLVLILYQVRAGITRLSLLDNPEVNTFQEHPNAQELLQSITVLEWNQLPHHIQNDHAVDCFLKLLPYARPRYQRVNCQKPTGIYTKPLTTPCATYSRREFCTVILFTPLQRREWLKATRNVVLRH